MKKTDKSSKLREQRNVEYAALTINTDIENRSKADEVGDAIVNDNELEFIKAHWQDKIKKHQPPIIRTKEDLKLLDKGKNP